MPNHVHLILVPSQADGLRRALAPVHRRYAGIIHARRKRTGHFWQGRFGCVAMDEEHLAAALRYVSLNPVRARLVDRARDWRWSSVRAHLGGRDDGVTALAPVCERYPDFANFLSEETDAGLICIPTTALLRSLTMQIALWRRSACRTTSRRLSAFWLDGRTTWPASWSSRLTTGIGWSMVCRMPASTCISPILLQSSNTTVSSTAATRRMRSTWPTCCG